MRERVLPTIERLTDPIFQDDSTHCRQTRSICH